MKKIFIVGNSRSGTTMLGRMFDSHSKVHTFDELHFFEHQIDASTIHARPTWDVDRRIKLAERLLTSERDSQHFFAKLVPGTYSTDATKILALAKGDDPISVYEAFLHFETQSHRKDIPCEQTPRYLFYVQEILDAFPDAIIINLIRDPRDVLLSQKNKWRRRLMDAKQTPLIESIRAWVNYHPYTITRLWVSSVQAANKFATNERFISIRFEDLLESPETNMRTLCAIVGIEFEPNMLQVSQIGSSTEADKPQSKGIDAGRSGSWRKGGLTDTEIAICQKVAADEMIKLGYASEPIGITPWRWLLTLLSFTFKISLALLLNLKRTTNLRETLRRRLGL